MERPARLAMMVSGLALVLGVAPGTGARAQSDTHRQDGVTLRLVSLAPDAKGRVHGALSVELDPGWKTYWIAPGPVGLAPRLDFSASNDLANADFALPVPMRFAEGEAQSVGFDEPVAFAVRADANGPSPALRVDVFLGVCRELCVPVEATLTAEPARGLSDRALVARAEAATPPETGPLPVRSARWNADGSALLVEAMPREGGKALDAFASAGDGWSFGAPLAKTEDGQGVFALPVLSRPSGTAMPATVDLLLTAGEIAQLSRAVPITPR